MLVIRGENSDILLAESVAARSPDLRVINVPDQGHVLSLAGALNIKITQFIRSGDPAHAG
jgi:hypothetical protein